MILLYYHYKREGNEKAYEEIVKMLETERHLDSVVRVLFRHYGQSLYDANIRLKLLSLEREHSEIIKKDAVRYHYYRYVTYSYNKQFQYVSEELNKLRKLPFFANPEIQQFWFDENGEPRLFEAKYDQGRRHFVFLPEIQRSFPFRGPKVADETFKVALKFLVSGITARIVPNT